MIKNFIFKFKLPNDYINHHLRHLQFNIASLRILNFLNIKNNFWMLNIDSMIISFLLGFLFLFTFKLIIFNLKYNYIPNKFQILCEIIILFIYKNIKQIIGKIDKYIFSLCFTIFTWILMMNLMGLIPIDLFPIILKFFFNINYFYLVPSSDINITTSFSFCVLLYIFIYKIYKIGLLNMLYNLFIHPFNSYYFCIFNLLLEFINIFSKFLSLSLRLFANIYSGEIIFILLFFILPWWIKYFFIFPWFILHICISFLQAVIFMILTLIYIS